MTRTKSFLKSVLLWSWVVSLPIVLLGGYWAVKTYQRYDTFAVRYGTGNVLPPVDRFAQYEFSSIKRQIKAFLLSGIAKDSEFPVINLKVPQSELAKLNSHLPQSGFNFVKGTLETENGSMKIKYRYRGDFPVHWAYQKKSIRVKTGKKELFNGIRSFNLQAPKFDMQVNNFLSYKLAEEMGLLVPRSELVSVTLNGKRIGTHIFVEQLEEMTLRHRLVMPGDIYRGEIVGKDRYLISGYAGRNLFDVPGFWDKMSVNNHYDDSDAYPLKEMIAQVRNADFEASQKGLSKIMDMEAWGRFSAFESLTNTYHFDNSHNWRIYYDPWRQKLVPIVWDATGWMDNWRVAESKGKAITPQAMSALHAKLFQNGDFVRARNAALAEFFETGKDKEFVKFTNDTIEAVIRESKYDPYQRPTDDNKLRTETRKLGKYIERVMTEGVDYTAPDVSGVTYSDVQSGVRLSVNGRMGVKRVRLLFAEAVNNDVKVGVVLSEASASTEGVVEKTTDLSEVTTLSGSEMILDSEFLSSSVLSAPGLLPHRRALTVLYEQGDYDIMFSEPLGTLKTVSVDMGRGWEEISKLSVDVRKPFIDLYKPVPTPPKSTPEVWEGSKTISGVVEVDSPIIIKPGTTIYMEENASLIMRNKLDVLGTAEAPVRFVRTNGQVLPWGTIALLGEKANNSNLSHCVMDGGSGYKERLFEYSGMFSVHDVQGLTIDNCEFRNGTIVDDMVHIVYSSVDLSDSLFDTCLSDALDIDISEAKLDNVTFLNSGNDAVDLMSSYASITNSTFTDSGDKGISVGEGSRLLGVNNVLKRNEIGVQIKDGSKAFLYNQTITDNVMAIDAYKKNWRYNAGGEAFVKKSILASNESALSSDKKSQIMLFDSYIDKQKGGEKSVSIYGSDRESLSTAANIDSLLPENMDFNAENLAILERFDPSVMKMRDPARRGSN